MILADTSAWIDFLRGSDSRPNVLLAQAIERNDIVLGDLVVAELLSGFRVGRQLSEFEAVIAQFPVYSLCGEILALKAAANYRALRSKGVTARGIVDVIIATWCIENTVPLLHADRDFEPMEKILGLQRWKG
jgi:predicted nucleic acid-binding protein